MKKAWVLLFILLVFLVLGGCSKKEKGGESVKKRVIKLSHSHQADFSSEIHTAAWLFENWVEDNSESLEVKIYASGSLGSEREVYEGIQLGGGASCIISGTAILNNFNPRISVLDLPFLWKDYDHVHKVLDCRVGSILTEELKEQGFIVLAWMDSWGWRNIVVADKNVEKADDLKGLKIRTIQTPIYVEALNAMGVNATPMSFGEVYPSMQTGVLDGFEHTASVVKANKFYEVADQITRTEHLFGPLVFAFSKAEWQELGDKEKKVIKEAAEFARNMQRDLAPIRDKQAFEFLKEKGVVINDIDTNIFKKEAVKIQDRLANENKASDLLEMIRKAR